jgi:uncharacterized membrane protein YkvI
MNHVPLGGILGMFAVTLVIWGIVLAVTFEFSRKFRAYDYRTFFMNLIGRFWFIFEVLYIITMLLVLAVIGSAAGILLRDNFGIPYIVGVIIMLASIGFLTFKGASLIEKVLSGWSFLIYIVYALFLIVALLKFGLQIQKNLLSGLIISKWALGGFKYALYNMCAITAVFFCINHIETRKEAIAAGLIGGLIGILPGFFFYVAVLGHYPDVISEELPAIFVLQKAGVPSLLILFQIALFGTLIETGTGFIHAVNERIQSTLRAKGKKFPAWQRPLVAIAFLLASLGISTFGLISLVAKGYGSLSWGLFIVFFVPLMTLGLYKAFRRS